MYTGELFGVEYLYSQTGSHLPLDNLDEQIDEGFNEEELEADPSVPLSTLILEEHPSTVAYSKSESDEDGDTDTEVCHIIIFLYARSNH